MAVVMVMEWPEVTKAQYEAVRADLDWVTNKPMGGLMHAAGFGEEGFRAVDLWESAEDFQNFVASKLQGAVAKVGITSQPAVKIFPAEYLDLLAFDRK